jgi:hypothetical protein
MLMTNYCAILNGQNKPVYVGLIVREDIQLSPFGGTPEQPQKDVHIQPRFGSGIGAFASKRGTKFGWNGSLLLSGAKYKPVLSQGGYSLDQVDLKLAMINLSAMYFPGGRSYFVEAGPQLLHRRFGTEYYTGGILDRSYWPKNRIMINVGAGSQFTLKTGVHCRIGAGIRINPVPDRIIYDTRLNQIWISAAVGLFQVNSIPRREHSRNCYSF